MRIEPTHFIEVWKGIQGVHPTRLPINIEFLINNLFGTFETTGCHTIALFKLREKTPSEKANWGERLKELTNSNI